MNQGLEILRSVSTRQGNAAAAYEGVRELYRHVRFFAEWRQFTSETRCLKLHTKTGSLRRPLEVVRFLEDEISKGEKKLVRFPDFCLHTAYKFCNRTQYPCAGILLRQATGFDGHPAASNSAMPCPGARPALADRAPPSMPEIATGLAPKGTVHCAYMISAVTVGAKCNSC